MWNNVTEEQWLFMKEISSDGDVSTVRMCELDCVYMVLMLAHKPRRTFPVCVYICVRRGTYMYAVAVLDGLLRITVEPLKKGHHGTLQKCPYFGGVLNTEVSL